MAKKKIYAVKKGKTTGIFRTWAECSSAVKGYSGAQYKGFCTMDEAEQYLYGKKANVPENKKENEEDCQEGQVVAYVDGSFDDEAGRYGFGCVILLPNGEIVRKSGNGNDPDAMFSRNVAGEILGAVCAVKWCASNGYKTLKICYDYMGIEMWATGEWKAKKKLTMEYAGLMEEYRKKIDISFRKIVAHTGDKYNEEADRLAGVAVKAGSKLSELAQEKPCSSNEKIPWADLVNYAIGTVDKHLTKILIDMEISNMQHIEKNGYDMFEKDRTEYKLCHGKYGHATEEQVEYIGRCYTFLENSRNALSVQEEPNENCVYDLIKKAFVLINEYYELT